jgi:inorganic phosphate transporter, PiT family
MLIMTGLVVVVVLAFGFAFTNGFHDSSNTIAALVATRAARPVPALLLAAIFNALGPLVAGAAVADTVGGILAVSPNQVVSVVGAALVGALAWNLITWWRGVPSSSSHALVGGLVGAGLVAGGWHALHWGGLRGVHPVGIAGVLVTLAVSPIAGFGVGYALERGGRRALRRARSTVSRSLQRLQWLTASALAFSHGANDTQKTIGVITLLLLSTRHLSLFAAPLWVKLVSAVAMTLGTASGGWRIVRTVGRGIYRIRSLEGLASQTASAAVILSSAAVGGPVSTTHVVASSVVGVGAGRHWRRVRWAVASEIGAAWLVTLPTSALLAAGAAWLWSLR